MKFPPLTQVEAVHAARRAVRGNSSLEAAPIKHGRFPIKPGRFPINHARFSINHGPFAITVTSKSNTGDWTTTRATTAG